MPQLQQIPGRFLQAEPPAIWEETFDYPTISDDVTIWSEATWADLSNFTTYTVSPGTASVSGGALLLSNGAGVGAAAVVRAPTGTTGDADKGLEIARIRWEMTITGSGLQNNLRAGVCYMQNTDDPIVAGQEAMGATARFRVTPATDLEMVIGSPDLHTSSFITAEDNTNLGVLGTTLFCEVEWHWIPGTTAGLRTLFRVSTTSFAAMTLVIDYTLPASNGFLPVTSVAEGLWIGDFGSGVANTATIDNVTCVRMVVS